MMVDVAHLVAMMMRKRVGGASSEERQGDGGGKNLLHVRFLLLKAQ